MKQIGRHVNIINLLGVCTQPGGQPLLVIVEFAGTYICSVIVIEGGCGYATKCKKNWYNAACIVLHSAWGSTLVGHS